MQRVTGEALHTISEKWTFLSFFFFFFNIIKTTILNSMAPLATHPTGLTFVTVWRYCTLAMNLQSVHAQFVTDNQALATWKDKQMVPEISVPLYLLPTKVYILVMSLR